MTVPARPEEIRLANATAADRPMLSVEGLGAGYGAIQAIHNITLGAPRGRIVTIIGANGAGKSTLLKAIAGLNRNITGTVAFDGKPITDLSADRIVGLGLSLVAEGRQIFAHMSVEDNIRLGGYLYYKKGQRALVRQQMQKVYDLFPILAKRARQISGSLSGGEQQMLAIARALMISPTLLLLDEPSMGLAPIVVRSIFTTIQQLNDMGTTILLVEQNARAALRIADFGYVLETGRIVLEGPAAKLLDDPKVKSAYLGG
jgi:branched-chain amino acid transport system ATP-binding protein